MCSIFDPSQCMILIRGIFSVVGACELQKQLFLGSKSPEHCLQRSLHSINCTAWVAISKHGIIGAFWFKDDNEHFVTINMDRYVQVIHKFWISLGQGMLVVLAGRFHPTHLKRIIGMVKEAFF